MSSLHRIPAWILFLGLGIGMYLSHGCKSKKSENQRELLKTPAGDPGPTSPQARGGIIDGNGGEVFGTEHNPWFVGKAPVAYCIESSDGFSSPATQNSQVVREVFKAWKATLLDMNLKNVQGKFAILKDEGSIDLVLSLDFQEVKCSEGALLTFKLGTLDHEVEAALKFTAAKTIGFASKSSYSDLSGRSTGYIWLAPDRGAKRYAGKTIAADFWSSPHVLHNVLMHEVGHILGFRHIHLTIMDQRAPGAFVEKHFAQAWQGEEFRGLKYLGLYPDFCGKIPENSEPIKSIWKLSQQGLKACVGFRQELKENDDNTPLLLEIRNNQKVLASERITSNGVSGSEYDDVRLSGSYLEGTSLEDFQYVRKDFLSLMAKSRYRGYFHRDGIQRFVEIETDLPGIVTIRFALESGWTAMPLFFSSTDTSLMALTDLLESVEGR